MNALAYCAEMAGARRRIWRQGGKLPCQIARRQRAVEPCYDTAAPPQKKSHLFPLEVFDHAFMRFFLIVTNPY